MLSADLSARRYCGRSAIVVLVLEALVQAPWVLLGWLFQDLGTQVGVRQSVSESVRISISVSDLRVSPGLPRRVAPVDPLNGGLSNLSMPWIQSSSQ